MIAELPGGGRRLELSDGADLSGLTDNEVWCDYLAFGGTCAFSEVRSALAGDSDLPTIEHNRLAAVLNDHFIDDGDTYRVGYRDPPEPHIPAARAPHATSRPPPAVDRHPMAAAVPSHGPPPDVRDCHDPAVRHCDPPVLVWIDLRQLLRDSGQRTTTRPEGVSSHNDAAGLLTAWIASAHGPWLAVVILELERQGEPVMTTQALVPEWAVSARRSATIRPS